MRRVHLPHKVQVFTVNPFSSEGPSKMLNSAVLPAVPEPPSWHLPFHITSFFTKRSRQTLAPQLVTQPCTALFDAEAIVISAPYSTGRKSLGINQQVSADEDRSWHDPGAPNKPPQTPPPILPGLKQFPCSPQATRSQPRICCRSIPAPLPTRRAEKT